MSPPPPNLSLRHLPDLSDASLSFQIPLDLPDTSSDLLLADDDDDFLQGIDDTLSTPAPPTRFREPLRLSELTPRAKPRPANPVLHPSPPEVDGPRILESLQKPSVAPPARSKSRSPRKAELTPIVAISTQSVTADSSPVAQRFETLKTEINALGNTLPESVEAGVLEPIHGDIALPREPKKSNANFKRSRVRGSANCCSGPFLSAYIISSFTRSAAASQKNRYKLVSSGSVTFDAMHEADGAAARSSSSSSATLVSSERCTADLPGPSAAPSSPRIKDPEPNPDPLRLSEISPQKEVTAGDTDASRLAIRRVQPALPSQQEDCSTVGKQLGALVKPPMATTVASRSMRTRDATERLTAVVMEPTKASRASKRTLTTTAKQPKKVVPIANVPSHKPRPPSADAIPGAPYSHTQGTTTAESDEAEPNMTISEGVAARLMMYSQTMLPSVGLPIYESGPEDVPNNIRRDPPRVNLPLQPPEDNGSHLSKGKTQADAPDVSGSSTEGQSPDGINKNVAPRPAASFAPESENTGHSHQTQGNNKDKRQVFLATAPPISPMRSSSKRSSTTLDLEGTADSRRTKSRKMISSPSHSDGTVRGPSRPGPSAHSSLQKNPSETVSSTAVPGPQMKSLRSRHARVRSRDDTSEGIREKEGEKRAVWPASNTTITRNAESLRGANGRTFKAETGGKKKRPAQTDDGKQSTAKTGRPHLPGKQDAVLPHVNPTKPIGFTFQLDMRREARGKQDAVDDEKEKENARRAKALAVPDFRALHLAHEAALAARRGAITPIVPLATAGELNTEIRAREREKFDEAVRAKEAEMERLKEERRREQEEEEEREIRELRKRAIPRAHEVPGWYAGVPKREGAKGGP